MDTTPVALATADADGKPSVRIVLLRGADERGFVFHTNYTSRKGRELAINPNAALCFHWPTIEEQIRIEGTVERLPAEESDAYFSGRPRGSQTRRMGVGTERGAGIARHLRGGSPRDRSAVRRSAGAPAAVLGRVPHQACLESNSGTGVRAGCTTLASRRHAERPTAGRWNGSVPSSGYRRLNHRTPERRPRAAARREARSRGRRGRRSARRRRPRRRTRSAGADNPGAANVPAGRRASGCVRLNTITVATVSPKKIQSAKTT